MYFLTLLALLFTIPLAFATPYPTNTTSTITTTTTTITTTTATTTDPPGSLSGTYYLVTSVIGPGNADKNGLYVSGYHTGAGFNDVTLVNSTSIASIGFYNATYQQFDYDTAFPWGLLMGDDTNYAAWEFAMIDTGFGSAGFYFNGSGLQWNETDGGFDGWLACDWWHGVPQLFWKYFAYDYALPSSCAEVNLVAVNV